MNLLLEYLLRTDELKYNLVFPYSLLLNCAFSTKKIVLTIEKYGFGKLNVKHWFLHESRTDQYLPPHSEYSIEEEELFSSDKVILKGYEPLWYKFEPFIAGKKQNTDSPYAETDEKEYNSCLDNMINSNLHKKTRIKWLFREFIKVYKIPFNDYYIGELTNWDFYIRSSAAKFYQHWILWRKFLLDFSLNSGNCAGELLFHKEYSLLVEKEGNNMGNFFGIPSFII